jgi:hypothetical protein
MNCKIENSTMTCTLEAGETLERHVLQAAIQRAVEQNLWSVFLVLRPEVANVEFDLLSDLGFRMAGNLSVNNQYLYKLKKHLRWSGETGGSTAVPPPQLAPTHFEAQAQKDMQEKYSQPLSEARLSELQRMGKPNAIDSGTF